MRTRHLPCIASCSTTALVALASCTALSAPPKVILISLDGARPDLVNAYLGDGTLNPKTGLGLLKAKGISATQNITATPSLTAVSHIAIATGSTAANNDIPANTYHAVAQPIANNTSGFGGPIGGYQISPLAASPAPTAEPMWVRLRAAGRKVVTATWPGGDGVNVTLFGTTGTPIVQTAAPTRTVDYTVPFGAFGGIGAQGFKKTAADFSDDAGGTITAALLAAGRTSYSPVKLTGVLESIICGDTTFTCIFAACGNPLPPAALLHQGRGNRQEQRRHRQLRHPGVLQLQQRDADPARPVRAPVDRPRLCKGRGAVREVLLRRQRPENRSCVLRKHPGPRPLAGSLRTLRRQLHPAQRHGDRRRRRHQRQRRVLGAAARFPHPRAHQSRLRSDTFPDVPELEAMYEDQVRTFVAYQTSVGLRAIKQNQDADLVMIYIEQPDGSGHQFTLTDPRQPTDFLDNRSVGTPGNPPGAIGQSPARVAAFDGYLKFAYQQANAAVQAIIKAVGLDAQGRPRSNILVVSDHGMAPFHTAVVLNEVLKAGGMTDAELANLRFYTSGPAVNLYVNLTGREQGGTVNSVDYQTLRDKAAGILRAAVDPNPFYNPGASPLFSDVVTRPSGCGSLGFCVDDVIGQDFGDVFAMLTSGYNFDGRQSPAVPRLQDSASDSFIYSVPNFYGAHGHNSNQPLMSAILFGAGPDIKTGITLPVVNNIDIAPTIMQILGVPPAATVNGTALGSILLP